MKNEEYYSKQCDRRFEARKKLLLEKCGKNPFKKWFYRPEEYYSPYKKLRRKLLRKYVRNILKKGITIRGMNFGFDPKKLSTASKEKYTKHCDFLPLFCEWDYDDICQFLVLNLTIKGLYVGLFGNSTIHKQQMHEIWEAREKLLKSIKLADETEIENFEEWDKEVLKAQVSAFSFIGKHFRNWWD